MSAERLKWSAPGLELADLGVSAPDALYGTHGSRPDALERFEVLEDSPARLRARFALPGTPDLHGNLTGRPRALGTGFVWLTVHRDRALGTLLRTRFGAPPSASLAEREWNVLCHLRAHGVGTPEPLVVGARGAGLVARASFLVVRALEGAFPLPRWLRTDAGVEQPAERARGLAALALFLASLARSGVVLPALAPEHLWVTPSGSGECETEAPGLRKNKLPGIALAEVHGARLGPASARRAERMLQSLAEGLGRVLEPDEVAPSIAAARAALAGSAEGRI
jgi:hypothetical protein